MKKLIIFISFLFLASCGMNNNEEITTNNQNNMKTNTGTILALGDSLTAGYGVDRADNYPSQLQEKLSKNGYNYEIINAGISGDTSSGLKDRIKLYLDKEPDIVILAIGGNDGLRGLSLSDLKENINYIIDVFDEEPDIVLAGMQIPANLGSRYVQDFKDLYPQIAEENSEVFFYEFFLQDVAGVSKFNLPDRIHPTGEGYEIIVDNLYNFLENNNLLK